MKKMLIVVFALMVLIVLAGCGTPIPVPKGPEPGPEKAAPQFKLNVWKTALESHMLGGSLSNATLADVEAMRVRKITSVNVTPFMNTNWEIDLPSEDFDVDPEGWVAPSMGLTPGTYTFSLSCSDADGYEVSSGYIGATNIALANTATNPVLVTPTMDLSPISQDFVVTGFAGAFKRSDNQGQDGNVYPVKTTGGALVDDDTDWKAYFDSNGALHFSVAVMAQAPPSVINIAVKDDRGVVYNQPLAVDAQQMLNAIYYDRALNYAYQPVGFISINPTP